MWPRRQETVCRLDASPPRCAQLMGLASRGCLALVLGATAERRNLFFRSDLGLPWIRLLSLRLCMIERRGGRTRPTWTRDSECGSLWFIGPKVPDYCLRRLLPDRSRHCQDGEMRSQHS